jgi:hypothetical protein
MTRKDYEAIAKTFKDYPFTDKQDRVSLACRLATDVFIKDNPRFDVTRFLKACGVRS